MRSEDHRPGCRSAGGRGLASLRVLATALVVVPLASGPRWVRAASSSAALRVATGGNFSCAIVAPEGRITCWGDNDDGKATPPEGAYTDLALSNRFGCALSREANVVCWGRFYRDEKPPPGRFRQIAVGTNHVCGIREDGQLVCWGDMGYGLANAPAGTFTRVVSGDWHSCALDATGRARCWGYNRNHQCDVPADELVDLTATRQTTCGLRKDGSRICWGEPRSPLAGKLVQLVLDCGLTAEGRIACEEGEPPTGVFAQIARHGQNRCGVTRAGRVQCWGSNNRGEREVPEHLRDSPSLGPAIATKPPSGRITTGYLAACTIDAQQRPVCWGKPEVARRTPAHEVRQVSAGGAHVCAINADDTLACWGEDTYGQVNAPTLLRAIDVAAGEDHSCAVLQRDASISCWGAGRERTGGAHQGQANPPPGAFVRVTAAGRDTCGLRRDGAAVCWGIDYNQATTLIPGPFVEIAIGNNFGCGLSTQGEVRCWGSMDTRREGFAAVRAGYASACGIAADGQVSCWGGALEEPPPGVRFSEISVSRGYGCGLTLAGETVCWGSAGHGQTEPPTGRTRR